MISPEEKTSDHPDHEGRDASAMSKGAILTAGLILGIVLSALILLVAPDLREIGGLLLPSHAAEFSGEDMRGLAGQRAEHERQLGRLRHRMRSMQPRGTYLIIDSSGNKFYLMRSDRVIREGLCSSGSLTLLKTSDERQFLFETPRGIFQVREKLVDPVWKKPDWAFIEEGLSVPHPDAGERFESGVLGDYALYIGNGYLIHGTLYRRLLGLPATHGCIRLSDEDLSAVYGAMQNGSKVYIY